MSSDRGTTQPAGTGAGTFSAADLKRRMAWRAGPGWLTNSGMITLRPLGSGLRAEVLEYPGGMPGHIGFFLTWK
jgi:hypothetical protein